MPPMQQLHPILRKFKHILLRKQSLEISKGVQMVLFPHVTLQNGSIFQTVLARIHPAPALVTNIFGLWKPMNASALTWVTVQATRFGITKTAIAYVILLLIKLALLASNGILVLANVSSLQ